MTRPNKKKIKIRFQNGLSFQYGVKEILSYVDDLYEFIDSDDPEFIVFGPYGVDIPEKSDRYVRVGYYCENITPELSNCEWAFGIPTEGEITSPRYKKIQWHNLNQKDLMKGPIDIETIIKSKTKFCNFLYSNKVAYREEFFKALSKYKKVDAPGKSMNNMPSIDSLYETDKWGAKRQFLRPYKFTISFENYSYPGYQTEKLYDAMLEWSIPIYCGDPFICSVFNTDSFINAFDLLNPNYNSFVRYLEKRSQMDFVDFRPRQFKTPKQQIERKLKTIGRSLKIKIEFNGLNYKRLVDKIVEIDENENLYRKMLLQPWLNNNQVRTDTESAERWKMIFGK